VISQRSGTVAHLVAKSVAFRSSHILVAIVSTCRVSYELRNVDVDGFLGDGICMDRVHSERVHYRGVTRIDQNEVK
jgi:hypothetical protein